MFASLVSRAAAFGSVALLVRALTLRDYGIYASIAAVLSVQVLLDFGAVSGLVHYGTKAAAVGDLKTLRFLTRMTYRVYRALSGLAVVVAAVFVAIGPEELGVSVGTVLLAGCLFVSSNEAVVRGALLQAVGRLVLNAVIAAAAALGFVAILIVLWSADELTRDAALAALLVQQWGVATASWMAYRRLMGRPPTREDRGMRLDTVAVSLRDLLRFSLTAQVATAVHYLSYQGLKPLAGVTLGARDAAVLDIASRPALLQSSLLAPLFGPLLPEAALRYRDEGPGGVAALAMRAGARVRLPTLCFFVSLAAAGPEIVLVWTGEQLSAWTIGLYAGAVAMRMWQSPAGTVAVGAGMPELDTIPRSAGLVGTMSFAFAALVTGDPVWVAVGLAVGESLSALLMGLLTHRRIGFRLLPSPRQSASLLALGAAVPVLVRVGLGGALDDVAPAIAMFAFAAVAAILGVGVYTMCFGVRDLTSSLRTGVRLFGPARASDSVR